MDKTCLLSLGNWSLPHPVKLENPRMSLCVHGKRSPLIINTALLHRTWTVPLSSYAETKNGLHPLGAIHSIMQWRRRPDSNRGITVLQTVALATWLRRHDESHCSLTYGQCFDKPRLDPGLLHSDIGPCRFLISRTRLDKGPISSCPGWYSANGLHLDIHIF